MTGTRIRKSDSFSSPRRIRVLSLTVLAILIALAALAQQAGTSRSLAKFASTEAPLGRATGGSGTSLRGRAIVLPVLTQTACSSQRFLTLLA